MNILDASFEYFRDIFVENPGPKGLIMDGSTKKVLGLAITRTEILSYEVLITESISDLAMKKHNGMMQTMHAIYVIEPSTQNIDLICSELSDPHFSKYSLYFTNSTAEDILRKLATFDHYSLIEKVEEIFTRFYPLTSRLFHSGIQSISSLRLGDPSNTQLYDISDSLFTALQALHMRPCVRYDSSSNLCAELSQIIQKRLIQTSTLYGQCSDSQLLLILDRKTDPITPLTSSWYYSSALHNLFGIEDNIVTLPDGTQHVLDERHDTFYQEYGNKFLSEVGPAIHDMTTEAAKLGEKSRQKITSPEQISAAVAAATQFHSKMTSAKMHVALVDAINDAVQKHGLLMAAELEQAIATGDDAAFHATEIQRIANSPNFPRDILLRLAMLFALRYEGRCQEQHEIVKNVVGIEEINLMQAVVTFCGLNSQGQNNEDVFAGRSALKRLFSDIRSLYEVEQKALSQYKCKLSDTLRKLRSGALDDQQYPARGQLSVKPSKVVVYFIGGATYEEARAASEISKGDIDVIVGGTTVHSPNSFVNYEVKGYARI